MCINSYVHNKLFSHRATMRLIIYYSLLLQIFVTFENINESLEHSQLNGLEKILQRTETFFENLKLEFEFYPDNIATRHLIHTKVGQLVRDVIEKDEKVNKPMKSYEKKVNQQNKLEQEVDTLNNFEILSKWDLNNSIDVTYFNQRNNKNELITYVLALNYDGVSLLQLNHDGYIPIDFYSMANGKSIIIVDDPANSNNTLVIIKKTNGYTDIFNCNNNLANTTSKIHHVQTLSTPEANYLAAWYGFNHMLYLGVTSNSSITIYSWIIGQNFKLYQQIFHYGVNKLVPLRINETHAMSFATVGIITRIFAFKLKLNRFDFIQSLSESQDIVSFNSYQIDKHHSENFIVLVGKMMTIIHKNHHNYYIPYQQLKLKMIERVHSLVKNRTIFLFFVPKKLSETTEIFRYNGWKFVNTQINLAKYIIDELTLPFVQADQWHFAIKFRNNNKNESITWRILRMNSSNEKTTNWCDEMIINTQITNSQLISSQFPTVNQSHRINTDSITHTGKLSLIHNDIEWRVNELEKLINTKMFRKHVTSNSLRGKNVRVLSDVLANSTKSQSIDKIIQNLIHHQVNENAKRTNFELRNVTINSNVNFFCPIPAVNYKTIRVNGLINSIVSFENLIEDLLKLNKSNSTNFNCQIITGAHLINSVETINANIPSLDIGFNLTHQNIIASNITIDELEISGGLFLPVNHTGVYELVGTLSVNKAKIMEFIELNGHINGTGVAHLLPIVHYQQPIILNQHSNRHFNCVQIIEWLVANDIVGFQPKHSYNIMKYNSFSLNSINIPIHMLLRMNIINWNYVYISESFGSWLTINNSGISNVTGLKMISPNIKLNAKNHEIISVTTFENSICTLATFTDDIYTSGVTVDRATIHKLNTDAIFGDTNFDNAINVQRNITNINDEEEFNDMEFNITKWIRSRILRDSMKLKKLSVDDGVHSHEGIVIPLPREIKRMVVKQRALIDEINNINIDDFMKNVITIHDERIPSINMEFIGELEADEVIVNRDWPIVLSNNGKFNFNLGPKTIIGKVETKNVNILFVPTLDSSDNVNYNVEHKSVVDLIIAGNVTFATEPKIREINNRTVKNLFNNVWMKNRPAILTGKSMKFDKMIIHSDTFDVKNSVNTPEGNNNYSWSQFRKIILSKSKTQNITQNATFHHVHILNNVIGSLESKIISQPSTNLYNLEHNTFQQCKKKSITFNNWEFMKIYSTDSIEISGRINNLNLNEDVVRIDVEKNVITAAKTIDNLIANNTSHYLKFNELIRNALMSNITNNGDNTTGNIIISGRKMFETVELMNLKVKGKVAGKKVENCMQKNKTHQYFRGQKIIKGSLTTRNLIIAHGNSINNIDVIKLMNYHLKKKLYHTQIISNPIYFERGLKVFGNVTIDGWYQNVQLIDNDSWNLNKFFMHLEMIIRKIRRLYETTEEIGDTVSNRVTYWNKLEFVNNTELRINESTSLFKLLPKKTSTSIFLENLGNCHVEEMILICNNDEKIMNFSSIFDISEIIQFEMMSIRGVTFLAAVTSVPGGVIILSYVPELSEFHVQTKLDMPGISHGSIVQAHNSVWITLDVQDHTIILRYDIWNEVHQYLLPPSPTIHNKNCNHQQLFTISHTNFDDELLFIRGDGIWTIGGLSQPKRVIGTNINICTDTNISVSNNDLYFQLIDEKNNKSHFLKAHYKNN